MCTQLIHRSRRLDELAIHLQVERHALVDKSKLVAFGFVQVFVDRKRIVRQRLVIARELISCNRPGTHTTRIDRGLTMPARKGTTHD